MKFRTEYIPGQGEFPLLAPESEILLLGSCFSDNIGTRLQRVLWPATVNPCGVLYNPASVAACLKMALNPDYQPLIQRHLLENKYFCFDFSTKFSADTPQLALAKMNEGVDSLRQSLARAQALFITFGTSWIFQRSDGDSIGTVVANCHKLPSDRFLRRCMSVAEAYALWTPLIADLRQKFPRLNIITTVSPVRHLADGFAGNARSKARLLLLCEMLAEECGCPYFPAYEILMDDLRDYRFYASDLAHPSDVAADYVFEKFLDAFVAPEQRPQLAANEKQYRRSQHRPITT